MNCRNVYIAYDYSYRNKKGKPIIDFAVAYRLIIVNTYFNKREEHVNTFKSESSRIQIDFFLTKKIDSRICKNFKIIPEESLIT